MELRVSLPTQDFPLLKQVFPRLAFGGYADELCVPDTSDERGFLLTLLVSRSGIDLSSPLGLATLLKGAGLFSESKASTFAEKTFHSRRRMYQEASRMILLGHCSSDKDEDDFAIYGMFQEPFLDRIQRASAFGYSRVMKVMLALLEKRFNPDLYQMLSRTQKEFYVKLTSSFRVDLFRAIQLSGDLELDTLELLRCF